MSKRSKPPLLDALDGLLAVAVEVVVAVGNNDSSPSSSKRLTGFGVVVVLVVFSEAVCGD